MALIYQTKCNTGPEPINTGNWTIDTWDGSNNTGSGSNAAGNGLYLDLSPDGLDVIHVVLGCSVVLLLGVIVFLACCRGKKQSEQVKYLSVLPLKSFADLNQMKFSSVSSHHIILKVII